MNRKLAMVQFAIAVSLLGFAFIPGNTFLVVRGQRGRPARRGRVGAVARPPGALTPDGHRETPTAIPGGGLSFLPGDARR